MAHGDKKWIRDWRGRIKRSRHRTQQDWKGEFATSASTDRLIGYWKGRKCPQCRYLEKQAPIRGWRVRRDLAEITVAQTWAWHEHATYRQLAAQAGGWRIRAEHVHVAENGKARCILYVEDEVYRLPIGVPARYVRELRWPSPECDPCRRKDEISRRLWHDGGVSTGWWPHNNYTWARRQEQRDRRAEVRNIMQRAKHDPELYERIPRHKNNWLD